MEENSQNPAEKAQAGIVTLAEVAIQAKLRDKLLSEGVKLWMPPFYDEGTRAVNDIEILALASRYSTEMEIQESDVVDTLLAIQRNSVERLTERDFFKTTGLATLRIKQASQTKKLQVNLATTGAQLKASVAQTMNLSEGRIKLISSGKVISDAETLFTQGVKNGGSILVVVVGVGAGTDNDRTVGESVFKDLEDIKSSADYLAGKDSSGKYSLQVADQSGRALDLPESEKKALAISLALHDKGRAAMKEKDYSKALVYLLEADSVYSRCQSSILEMVDNFGMLNLDIAWCYLCLQSISDLPAVEGRLLKCEKSLHKSYGENFERVISLQGNNGAESALFVRLHLLQGIAAFHLGQTEKAKFLINKVVSEITRLQISDTQLAELVNMGYTPAESRTALRATFGDITASVDWIIRKREQARAVREQEKLDTQRRKVQKKLGKCSNGDLVSVTLFRNLREMGFDKQLSAEALRRTNNDINSAIQMVNDPIFISAVIRDQTVPGTSNNSAAGNVATTTQPGTATDQPGTATDQSGTATGLPGAQQPVGLSSADAAVAALLSASLDSLTSNEDLTMQNAEEELKSLKALETLSKDTCPESEYIDLSLSDETAFLSLYKELLHM